MTPKEKAIELIDKFTIVGLQQRNEGYQCAVIAVDEIIEILSKDINPLINYWFEVKQELENL